jgi:hypothetical protein
MVPFYVPIPTPPCVQYAVSRLLSSAGFGGLVGFQPPSLVRLEYLPTGPAC